jgi:hypothetical protein
LSTSAALLAELVADATARDELEAFLRDTRVCARLELDHFELTLDPSRGEVLIEDTRTPGRRAHVTLTELAAAFARRA